MYTIIRTVQRPVAQLCVCVKTPRNRVKWFFELTTSWLRDVPVRSFRPLSWLISITNIQAGGTGPLWIPVPTKLFHNGGSTTWSVVCTCNSNLKLLTSCHSAVFPAFRRFTVRFMFIEISITFRFKPVEFRQPPDSDPMSFRRPPDFDPMSLRRFSIHFRRGFNNFHPFFRRNFDDFRSISVRTLNNFDYNFDYFPISNSLELHRDELQGMAT